jgi:hypothetical protein
MRTVLLLVLGVGVLTALGVVHFKKRGDRVDVSIDTGRLEEKTEDFIDAVKDTITDDPETPVEEAMESVDDGVRRVRGAIDDVAESVEDHVRDARRRFER